MTHPPDFACGILTTHPHESLKNTKKAKNELVFFHNKKWLFLAL
jgi:hypothetical protein